MVEKEKLIQYCRQLLDETEARELEAVIQSDPLVRSQYKDVVLETLLDDLSGEDVDSLPDESDPNAEERRAFIARQLDECRRSEWWSLVPEDSREFAELEAGQSLRASVRRLQAVEDAETGFTEYREQAFSIEVQRLSESRYRLSGDDWPADYRLRALRLGQFRLADFPSLSAGDLPKDERVERSTHAGSRSDEGREVASKLLDAASRSDGGILAGAGMLAAADRTNLIASAEEPGIRITLDREQLTISLSAPEPTVLAVAEMDRLGEGRRRLPVQRRAVVLAPRGERRIGFVDNFDYPSRTRKQDVRVMVRPLEADDLYLLQTPALKSRLDGILADQPASSASANPCDGGYQVQLWTEQYELARDPATCWALQMVPDQGEARS